MIVLVSTAALCYGTVVHLVQVGVGGLSPYPEIPDWLAIYFVSLAVLDPVAAGRIAQAIVTVLALALVTATPRLWSSSRPAVSR